MENTHRDVNIAIANEFARSASRFSIDAWEGIKLANRHPRVKILNPRPGVGGHCMSLDPWFLIEAAPDLTSLSLQSRRINDSQSEFVVELVNSVMGTASTAPAKGLLGRKIAALGLAYKPDVDDLRESPAIEVVRLLSEAGAIVKAFEPFNSHASLPGVASVSTLEEALQDSEIVLLLVSHTEFRSLSPETLRSLTPARILIDTVNVWHGKDWQAAGFHYTRHGVRNQA